MRIGIDLGGTKIEAIALDHDGQELARLRRLTPRGNYRDILDAIAALITEIENQCGQKGSIGLCHPGSLNSTGFMRNANTTELNGQPFQFDLEKKLQRPVRTSNDANCFALSEAVDGAGAGYHCVFGVIVGTGTGGGIVIDGKVHHGCNGIGGEWGHNPLPQPQPDELPGPTCYCGRQGCIETFLCGPSLTRRAEQQLRETLSPTQLISLAEQGLEEAEVLVRSYVSQMARALASIINVLDPDCIVLGGGLSNIQQLYTAVPAVWSDYIFSDEIATKLVRAKHGDSSGVRGAAWLWD